MNVKGSENMRRSITIFRFFNLLIILAVATQLLVGCSTKVQPTADKKNESPTIDIKTAEKPAFEITAPDDSGNPGGEPAAEQGQTGETAGTTQVIHVPTDGVNTQVDTKVIGTLCKTIVCLKPGALGTIPIGGFSQKLQDLIKRDPRAGNLRIDFKIAAGVIDPKIFIRTSTLANLIDSKTGLLKTRVFVSDTNPSVLAHNIDLKGFGHTQIENSLLVAGGTSATGVLNTGLKVTPASGLSFEVKGVVAPALNARPPLVIEAPLDQHQALGLPPGLGNVALVTSFDGAGLISQVKAVSLNAGASAAVINVDQAKFKSIAPKMGLQLNTPLF